MRISDQLLSNNYLSYVNKTKSEMQNLQNQILTGSKINKPSDSPSGASRSMRLQESIASNETYTKNIENAYSFLQVTTSTMESLNDEAEKIQILFTNMANPTDTNLNTYADQIDLTLKSMMDLANSEYEGKYIFGGTDFSDEPYGFTKDAAGNIISAQQNVTSTKGIQNIKISTNTTQKINVPGDDIFGDLSANSDIFNTLIQIRDNLRNGIKPTNAQTKVVSDFSKNVLSKMTSAGEVMNRLDSTKELLSNQNMELQSLLADEKEVDTAKAIVDLQNQQYYLDLSYKMSSMILPKSLLDFM